MKTNKFISLILFIIINIHSSRAQDSYIEKRWSIKASYSNIESNVGVATKQEIKSNYGLEVNYGAWNIIEPNLFLNFTISDFNIDVVHYGLGSNFHLLPLFIKSDDFRFDFYVAARLGKFNVSSSDWNDWEYGFGPGLNFYIFKHWGVFGEFYYGKYFFEDNTKFRFGLCYKFKKS